MGHSITPLHLIATPRTFLKHKNEGVKVSNDKLKKEKSEYQVIFGELTGASRLFAYEVFACSLFMVAWQDSADTSRNCSICVA